MVAIDHGYAAMPQLALPAPGPEAQLRRTVAETLATSYESPSGKQMPAELLDEACFHLCHGDTADYHPHAPAQKNLRKSKRPTPRLWFLQPCGPAPSDGVLDTACHHQGRPLRVKSPPHLAAIRQVLLA